MPARSSSRTQGQSVESIASALRAGIREGVFTPGQRLVAAALVGHFGVSLGVMREALSTLSGEGLVDVLPNRGAVVRVLDRSAVVEIYQIRQALEGQAAALAANRIDAAARRQLRAAQAMAHRAAIGGQLVAYRLANHELHGTILALSGNRRLQELSSQQSIPIHQRQLVLLLDRAAVKRSDAEHARIVDAIVSADGGAAQREMAAHIRNSCEALLTLSAFVA